MKKYFGDSVFKDGKHYHWCPHYVYKCLYDGLYVTHLADKHDEWQAQQDCKKQNRKDKMERENLRSSETGSSDKKSSLDSLFDSRLVLLDKFRQAMLTDHGFYELQFEQLTRFLGKYRVRIKGATSRLI